MHSEHPQKAGPHTSTSHSVARDPPKCKIPAQHGNIALEDLRGGGLVSGIDLCRPCGEGHPGLTHTETQRVGCGRPEDGGVWAAKTSNDPHNNQHNLNMPTTGRR